jgi:hypothetical protein
VGTWCNEFCAQFTLFNQPYHKVCSKPGWASHEVLYTTKHFQFLAKKDSRGTFHLCAFLWSFKDAPFHAEVNYCHYGLSLLSRLSYFKNQGSKKSTKLCCMKFSTCLLRVQHLSDQTMSVQFHWLHVGRVFSLLPFK